MNLLNYIHKSPHRNQLEEYLRLFLPVLVEPILDIGSKNRRYDYLLSQKPMAIDIIKNEEKNVQQGNILDLNFSDKSFQSVICLEVLEYVLDTDKAINEVSRVLTDGGTFIFSIPFMYKAHQDKVRYTKEVLSDILAKYFTKAEFYPVGNFYTIILDIIKGQIMKTKITPLKYFYYLLYLPWVLLIPIFRVFRDDNYASGYFIVAKK